MRYLWWMLLAGLVVGCSIERKEPTSGVFASADSNNAEAVDGQEVPPAEDESSPDEPEEMAEDDESSPCGTDRLFADAEAVTDNTDHKRIFGDSQGEGLYVYALLVVKKAIIWIHGVGSVNSKREMRIRQAMNSKYSQHRLPSCLAVRFSLNEDYQPIEMKAKTVAGFRAGRSFTLPLPTRDPAYHDRPANSINPCPCHYATGYCGFSSRHDYAPIAVVGTDFRDSSCDSPPVPGWTPDPKVLERTNKRVTRGIPMGDRVVVHSLLVQPYQFPHKDYYITYFFNITKYAQGRYHSYWVDDKSVNGTYVNMLPAEVRRRYFPEDINN